MGITVASECRPTTRTELRETIPALESGLVTTAADSPEATVARLAEDGIVGRSLPGGESIRASVHAYNAREGVDAPLEALPSA